MKKIQIIVILIITISYLSACTHKKDKTSILLPELTQAESIMYEHPDSALYILQGMQVPLHQINYNMLLGPYS